MLYDVKKFIFDPCGCKKWRFKPDFERYASLYYPAKSIITVYSLKKYSSFLTI